MKKALAAVAAAFALTIVTPAQAISFVSASGNGNTVDTSFSTPSMLSVDVDFFNANLVEVTFALEAADIDSGSFAFNSIVKNMSGTLINTLNVWLSTGAFTVLGSVTPTFGTLAGNIGGSSGRVLTFAPGEPNELYIGNPLATPMLIDWRIGGFIGFEAGDQFTLRMATPVPEPGSLALMMAGLLGVATMARRRRADIRRL